MLCLHAQTHVKELHIINFKYEFNVNVNFYYLHTLTTKSSPRVKKLNKNKITKVQI